MIDFVAIRNEIISSLGTFMGYTIIDGNSTNKKPPRPYGSYVVTTPLNREFENPREYSFNGGVNTRKEDILMTFSFNFHSDTFSGANVEALKALSYFQFYETLRESDSVIIVVDTTVAQNRDVLLVEDRERRVGFDVIFRVESNLTRNVDNIDDFQYTLNTST